MQNKITVRNKNLCVLCALSVKTFIYKGTGLLDFMV